ncbi:hypothetical protein HDU76_002320 [Blyttiomyces sp. JEL0837]|nr:hypothetical protein HDU76_002320 [Blyttiomyces sp. JEL0837]
MGLGKTAQVIAFLSLLYEKGTKGPHLIIVPSSTIENWMREFEKWSPKLEVNAYYGNQEERGHLRYDLEREPGHVIITTYNLASSSKYDRSFLKNMKWESMILDEGHMMKNMNSARFKFLNSIRSYFRLLLTGTPLQNNLMELLSLLTFILPNQFRSEEHFLNKIFNTKVANADPNAALLSRQRIKRARRMMTPFVLRRKKTQVLTELPSKTKLVQMCPPTQVQAELLQSLIADCKKTYLAQTATAMAEAAKGLHTPTTNSKKKGTAGPSRKSPRKAVAAPVAPAKRETSNILMQLRKAANHPLLFRRHYTQAKLKVMAKDIMKEEEYLDANYQYILEDMEVMSDFELHKLACKFKSIRKHQLTDDPWMDSGKVQKLKDMLPEMIEKGDRILIFSQFVIILDILESVMATMKIKFLRLDGQTNVVDRQNLIDEFNEDPTIPVFLLSTKAGGLGLNLTSANTVIIHDIDFNPHNDAQAEDRAHRVGQTRNVMVHKLITQGSIEQHILRLADMKIRLDHSMQQNGDADADEDADDAEDDDGKKKKKKAGEGDDGEDIEAGSGNAAADQKLMEMLRNEWLQSESNGGDVIASEGGVAEANSNRDVVMDEA